MYGLSSRSSDGVGPCTGARGARFASDAVDEATGNDSAATAGMSAVVSDGPTAAVTRAVSGVVRFAPMPGFVAAAVAGWPWGSERCRKPTTRLAVAIANAVAPTMSRGVLL